MRAFWLMEVALFCASCCSATGVRQVKRIHYQGKPMFMIGAYHHPSGAASKAVLDDLANAGFNTLLVPPATSDEILAEMDRIGVHAMVVLGEGMVLSGGEETRKAKSEKLRENVLRLKDKPALLGWEGPDEPLWNWKQPYRYPSEKPTWELQPGAQELIHGNIDALKDGYALIKSLCPDHPVFLNFAPRSEVEELQWFTSQQAKGGYESDGRTAADVFGVDIYPVPGGTGNNGFVKGVIIPNISTVGAFTRKQREIAGYAPIYMVLQGCGILDWDPENREKAQRHPTYAETRFMAFQAVANGANGILWWGMRYISPGSELWSDIKRVARQLRSLEPVLAEGEAAPVSCSAKQVELIRYVWKGLSYVIAVNAGEESLEGVSIGWPGLASGKVNVLFEGRTTMAAGGRVRDTFGPFEVHVYSDDFSSAATTTHKTKCAFGLPLDSEPFKGKPHSEVAHILREMGIDAVCAVPENRELIRELHLAGIKAYAEMGMFIGKRHWESHPESRPVNSKGEPVGEPHPGYCGVCPNQDWLRQEILENVTRKFQMYEYDGLWLDFIRYAGRWEMKKPVLEDSCFCDVCLRKFAESSGIRYPIGMDSTRDRAQWVLANHREKWIEFKCSVIADFTGQVKAEMRHQNHEAILGVFNVPWTREDFDGAVLSVLGQDVRLLAEHVDVFSPMVYHEMCGFPMQWVGDYTNWVWENTRRQVWPIVQVCDEPSPMSPEVVFRTMRTALDAYGSTGVMMFTFRHALDDDAKLEALKESLMRR